MAFRTGRVRMDVQLAEQPAERLVLIERQLLVAEEDHLMRHQRVVHFLELLIAERPARSTPEISAPMAAVTGFTSMVS